MAGNSKSSFYEDYQAIEEMMKNLAEKEKNIYLPNPRPKRPVQFLLICMEPSLGTWARNKKEARQKVKSGFHNFLFSFEDFILHFCVRRYLCSTGERYHITDLSKGAMPTAKANKSRYIRYEEWFPLLKKEIELVAEDRACIIAVGNIVHEFLSKEMIERKIYKIMHYSRQAGQQRNKEIMGRESEFREFCKTITMGDMLITAAEVIKESGLPDNYAKEALSRLCLSNFTLSRKKLIYYYKRRFESIRADIQ